MSILILLLIAILVVILAFIIIDLLMGAMGGDGRLALVLKAIVAIIALVFILQRTGTL